MQGNTQNKKWIAFNFDPYNVNSSKLQDNESPKKNQCSPPFGTVINDFNFNKCLEPKSIEDLAVHPKKMKEVESWLYDYVLAPNVKTNVPILLLTGPAGAGKTATVKVLCEMLNLDIQEWINPIDKDYENFKGPGQATRFLEFLLDAKFPSLLSSFNNKKKIVVVEDIPNVLLYRPEELVGILRNCTSNGKSPIVFISTEINVNNSSLNIAKNIFTEEVRNTFNIHHVSFNSCSVTLVKKCLNRAQDILQQDSRFTNFFKIPSQDTLDTIIGTSSGDIRNAITQFYLAALKNFDELNDTEILNARNGKKKAIKRKRSGKSVQNNKLLTLNTNMHKDESLGLFHGLGRVLNPKRVIDEDAGKWKFQCDLGLLVDEFSVQPSIFNAFLHENYLRYFGDFNDIVKASEILSFTQCYLEKWSENLEYMQVGLWVSVLGLMVSNEHKVSKWNQIRAPQRILKIKKSDGKSVNLAMDRYYFNLINNADTFHKFEFK